MKKQEKVTRKSKIISISLDPEVYGMLQHIAKQQHRSISGAVAELIWQAHAEEEKNESKKD